MDSLVVDWKEKYPHLVTEFCRVCIYYQKAHPPFLGATEKVPWQYEGWCHVRAHEGITMAVFDQYSCNQWSHWSKGSWFQRLWWRLNYAK
jgi:hypothetical protein